MGDDNEIKLINQSSTTTVSTTRCLWWKNKCFI